MADPIDWGELLAGGEGAANEALFGAPEWLIRKLGGGENLDAKIARYKQAHDIGGTIGLVGSSLIPGAGIAKDVLGIGSKAARAGATALDAARAGEAGLDVARATKDALGIGSDIARTGEVGLDATRAAKGAETALDLSKAAASAGDVGKAAELADAARAARTVAEAAQPAMSLGKTLLDYGTKGAATGALEQGARGYFKDESAPQIGSDVQQGILFGGLGGAAGGALSKFAEPLARLAKKATVKANVGLTGATGRMLQQSAKVMAGEGSGPLTQVQKAGQTMEEISDMVKKYHLGRPEAVENASSNIISDLNNLTKAYEAKVGGLKGSEVLAGALSPQDMATLQSKYDPDTIKEALEKLMGPVQNRTGFQAIRDKLEDQIKFARSGKMENNEVANAMFDAGKTIRDNLTQAVIKSAKDSGINVPDNLYHEYGLMLPIARGEIKSETTPTKFPIGSPTFGRVAGATILGGGSLLGDKDTDLGTKVARAAAGSVLGFAGGKALSKGMRELIAHGDTLAGLARNVAPDVAENAGSIATAGARLAANANRAVQEAAPATQGQAEAAKEGADLGQASRNDYMSQVLAKLTEYARANGVEPDTQDFKDFVRTVGSATTGEDGQPFDAKELAGMFYPDPRERAKFVRALEVSRGLSANLGTALKSAGGIAGIGEDPATKIEKTSALDKLAAVVGNAAKESVGTDASAKKMLATIINSHTSQTEKRKMIQAMMENYGVDFSTLGRVGLNV
jgi:phage gp16-like protein